MISSKTITNHIILFLAVLLLSLSSVSAITEDFSAFASIETIRGGACDLTTDHITIHNTGDVTSTYIVDVSGTAAEWTDIAPQTFYLEQGEIKQIERFIKVPCKARGEYTLNTTIKTLFDTEKVIEQTLDVKNIPNVQIIPKFSGTQTECPCTPVQYSFEVVNTGSHMETYELSVEPYSEAITMSTDFLILEPGQKEEVVVFINLACGEYGEKPFTFNALAQGTQILGQTDFVLDIQKCYEYELVVGQEYNVCQGVPNVIPFQINNNADIANEYFFTVSGAEWAYPENESVALWGGETGESAILVFPPTVDADGETLHSITLSTFSARGEEIAEQEIILETEKCYDYKLQETEGAFNAIECKQKDHVFVLQNTGSRETNYYVDLEGLDWLSTTTASITLAGGEEVEIVISGETPCDMSGDYLENIYVTLEEIEQTYLEEKTFSIYPKEEAYLPEIEISDLEIDYEGGETEIKITNRGYETTTYNLGLIASDWITLDTSSVTLAPGENATAWLMAYPTNETWPDTYSGEFIVRVAGEDIEYAIDFFVDLKEDRGLPMWAWIAIIGGGVLLILIIIIILVLVFAGKKPKKEDKKEIVKEDKKPKKDLITIDKREYRKEKKDDDKKVKLWPILLFLFIVAILAAGIYFAFTTGLVNSLIPGNETISDSEDDLGVEDVSVDLDTQPAETQPDDEILTNEDIQESLITIDRSGIPGSGNKLVVTDETEINIPLIITNPTDRKAKFEATNVEGSWLELERTAITIMPETTETTNIKITTDLEALEESDYSVTLNTVLEGNKIQYQETLDLVVTKKKPFFGTYWPWLLGGLIGLVIILLIIFLVTRKKSDKPAAVKKSKVAAAKPKKEKTKFTKKVGDNESSGVWVPIVVGLLILIILGALGFWAYNTFVTGDNTSVDESEFGVDDSGAAVEQTPTEEPKLTEDDVEESLITIDRENVPGKGNVLKLDQESYDLPVSIYNPTDRKAKFTVSTSNESWVEFDQYVILVGPQTVKEINMTLVPDMEALSQNDYMITINTKLEGAKIDYEEELSFVLKDDKPNLSWWLYALIGLLVIGLVVLVVEIVRRGKKDKPVAAKADKKSKKKAVKSAKKSKSNKTKDVAQINKEIAELRKKTVLKLKKGSK